MYDPVYKYIKKEYIKSTLFNYVHSSFQYSQSWNLPTFSNVPLHEREKGGQTLFRSHRDIPSSFLQKIKKKKKKTVSKETDHKASNGGNKNPHKSVIRAPEFLSPPFRIRGIRRNGEACCFERGEIGGRSSLIRNRVV